MNMKSFEPENGRTSYSEYYLPNVEIKEILKVMVETFLTNQ